MIVYRIQPIGADLHAVRSTTSNDDKVSGVFVFATLQELCRCSEWLNEAGIELAEIDCDEADIQPGDDYEGDVLTTGRGRIVRRRTFRESSRVAKWAEAILCRTGVW